MSKPAPRHQNHEPYFRAPLASYHSLSTFLEGNSPFNEQRDAYIVTPSGGSGTLGALLSAFLLGAHKT